MIKQTHLSDDQFARLLYKKDQQTFMLAYDRFSAPLYGIIIKMVKEPTLANFILKCSFERMWHQSYTLKQHTGRLFIWMHNITRGVIMEEMNKAIREEKNKQPLRRAGGFLA